MEHSIRTNLCNVSPNSNELNQKYTKCGGYTDINLPKDGCYVKPGTAYSYRIYKSILNFVLILSVFCSLFFFYFDTTISFIVVFVKNPFPFQLSQSVKVYNWIHMCNLLKQNTYLSVAKLTEGIYICSTTSVSRSERIDYPMKHWV